MEDNTPAGRENKSQSSVWKIAGILAVVAVVLYGLVLMANKSGNKSDTTNQLSQAPINPADSQQITVSGNEYAFDPSVITVKKGMPVQILFKNTGKYPHNLTISDLNVQTKTIQTGQQDTVTFTPGNTGQYTFTCTVPGHADKGMTGTINVQ